MDFGHADRRPAGGTSAGSTRPAHGGPPGYADRSPRHADADRAPGDRGTRHADPAPRQDRYDGRPDYRDQAGYGQRGYPDHTGYQSQRPSGHPDQGGYRDQGSYQSQPGGQPAADQGRADGHSPAQQPAAAGTQPQRRPSPIPVKTVIAGGFGVGKTTFVGAVSEIQPLTTEAVMTTLSEGIDDLSAVRGKTTTTVAMDFGRITVDDQLILYLFGTPGQSRFWFMWDDISRGSVGAVVLVDLRRIDDCFGPIDYFEDRRVPFVVAVNNFPGTDRFADADIREALALRPDCPLVRMDARDARSCLATLIMLVEHALARSTAA